MKTEFCYGANLALTVYDIDGENWTWGSPLKTLDEALRIAEMVFNGESAFLADVVDQIFITSGETGEIIAICHPDDWEPEDDEIENPNWDPAEIDWEDEDKNDKPNLYSNYLSEIADEICEMFL